MKSCKFFLTSEAKGSDIKIYRQKPGSKEQELIKADLNAIKKNQKPDILLQPYDVVEVGEAGLFSPSRLPQTLMGGISGAFPSMTTTIPTRALY